MSHSQLEQMLAESGLSVEEAPELVDLLAPLDDAPPAPAPSAALQAVFEGRPVPVPALPAGPRKRAVAGMLVLALSGVGATGLSAAANTLPRPLQHHVSEFSRHYLPFDLPEPPERAPRSAPQPEEVLPGEVDREVPEEASRSTADRPGAGAPDASVPSQPDRSHGSSTSAAQPGTSASPSASPSAGYAPASKPTSSPSGSPSASPGSPADDDHGDGKDQGKDRDKNKAPRPPGKDKGPGPDRPKPPGGGNELPQAPGQDPGNGGSDPAPAPVPELPLPPLPLPDLPPTPDPTGTGTDVTGN